MKPGANASMETRIYQVRDGSGSFVGGTSGSPCMVLGDNTFRGPHIGRARQDSFFGVAAPGALPHASITHKTALDTSLLQALHNRAVFATVKHGLVVEWIRGNPFGDSTAAKVQKAIQYASSSEIDSFFKEDVCSVRSTGDDQNDS